MDFFPFPPIETWYEYCIINCLTKKPKKRILYISKKAMMYKKCLALILAFLCMLITSCSRPRPQTQLQFGILAAQKGLWDEAIFRWKKVIQIDPNSAAAHNNLAVAYEKKGLWDEAEKEYETALRLRPNHDFIIANYEKFKSRLEDHEESDKDEDKDNKKKDKKEK